MEEIRPGSAQPRPALGLRPWFAFLRRARSLRRFAFAMAGRVAGAPRYRGLTLTDGSWLFAPVCLAAGFSSRLVGIHAPDVESILLRARSVHGKGVCAPLLVVHLTRSGIVTGHDVLPPRGTVTARSYWILELPLTVHPPPEGSVLQVLPSSSG